MYLDDQTSDKDTVEEQHGVRVVIDKMSSPYLSQATVDFIDSLEQTGFTIDNPAAQGGCACGNSFTKFRGRSPACRSRPPCRRRGRCAMHNASIVDSSPTRLIPTELPRPWEPSILTFRSARCLHRVRGEWSERRLEVQRCSTAEIRSGKSFPSPGASRPREGTVPIPIRNEGSEGEPRTIGVVGEVGPEPALRLLHALAEPARIVLDLILADLADVEVARLRGAGCTSR